jgi:LPS export ABC transporter protein LptC
MKRSEAAKYARWSAAAAALLAALTASVYLERKWAAHVEKKKAPPPAPEGVTRQESGLTFSKGLGAQKLFTVEASKATNFKDNGASLLEDVKITIFGKTGERHDTMHTQSCQYEKNGATIVCSGEVQLDLQSAENAERGEKNHGSSEKKIHVETRGVTFNRTSGIAQSDQPVKMVFPDGQGEAVGVEYHSEQGTVRLLRNVSFLLQPAGAAAKDKNFRLTPRAPIHITGRSAAFERESRVMRLHGPVEARTATARLSAGELTLDLNKAFQAEKLVAARGADGKDPEFDSQSTDNRTHLSAETMTAYLAGEGWLTRIEGAGNVRGTQQNRKNNDDNFSAENAALDFRLRLNQPKELQLNGDVQLNTTSESTGETRTLLTSALLVEFAAGEKEGTNKLERAETLATGTLRWTNTVPQATAVNGADAGLARSELTADKLELKFNAQGQASQLLATGNVLMDRALPGKPTQTASAQEGSAELLEGGGWSQMEMQGSVKLKEGGRNGQADKVVFVQSAQTATLTGNAVVRDATAETQAPRITFVQGTGEILAEGGVRSTDLSSARGGLQLAATPANISADTLRANSKAATAHYTGHARLWQGDSVLEADSIELLREKKVLTAVGHVRAVFPQAVGQSAAQPVAARQSALKKSNLWHVTAGTLTYNEAEARAHLEKNVVAKSSEQEMRAPLADLYFTRSGKTPAGPAGSQQIARSVGMGGVTVEQGSRRATAERGEYTAVDGKFVMSGGTPTIFDASEGTTTGRQLTFFLADDTIIVDSENGSRTLTKHRVEK